ncbi:lecithin retinol acyltransferase family protein [Pseudomonas silesiensis]|uniref:lecithin retinol acyltransferase family protein n=1 Tax=Pseudomonas silesiensis TaxID=1853130 RepID=UPI0034D7484F
MPTLLAGSHLVVGRGLYTHLGIYVGHDHVIHYFGMASGINKGCIELTSLKDFAQGKSIKVKTYRKKPFHRPQIYQRAKSKVGENKYNILFNNCEHFATWCVTGEHTSEQANAAITHTSNALVAQLVAKKTAEKVAGPVVRHLIASRFTAIAGNLISGQVARTLSSQTTRSVVARAAAQGATGFAVSGGAGGLTTVGLGMVGIAGGSVVTPVVVAAAVGVCTTYVVSKIWDIFTDW